MPKMLESQFNPTSLLSITLKVNWYLLNTLFLNKGLICNSCIAPLSLISFVSSRSFQAIYQLCLHNQPTLFLFNRKVEDFISCRISFLITCRFAVTFPYPCYYAKHFTHLPIHMFAGLNQLTTGECLDVLRSIGLPQHSSMFESNQVDGPMLEALIHPHLGQQLMLSLGVNDTSDRHRLVTELYRLKAHGYICNKHNVSSSSS